MWMDALCLASSHTAQALWKRSRNKVHLDSNFPPRSQRLVLVHQDWPWFIKTGPGSSRLVLAHQDWSWFCPMAEDWPLLSRNSLVAVTLTHGLQHPLYLRPEILILVLFFIRTSLLITKTRGMAWSIASNQDYSQPSRPSRDTCSFISVPVIRVKPAKKLFSIGINRIDRGFRHDPTAARCDVKSKKFLYRC